MIPPNQFVSRAPLKDEWGIPETKEDHYQKSWETQKNCLGL